MELAACVQTTCASDSADNIRSIFIGKKLARGHPFSQMGVDAVAAWDSKKGRLGLALINYSTDQEVALSMHLNGVSSAATINAWRINGPNLAAINQPGQPESVTTLQLSGRVALDQPVKLPPHSITVLRVNNTP
jgi:alpha-L-arabinofuranosidase